MIKINSILCGIITLLMSILVQASDHGSFTVQTQGNTGLPVILIPGLMSDSSVFKELNQSLSKQYKVHLISVKGFAGAPKSNNFSLKALSADIAKYIQGEGITKPTIVGHSMGGLTAFILASEYEDIIGKVVSIDGLPFIGPVFTRSNNTTVDMLTPQAIAIRAMFANMNQQQLAFLTQQSVSIQAMSDNDQARIVEMAKKSDPKIAGQAMYEVMTTDMRQAIIHSITPILMLGASGGGSQASEHEEVARLYQAQFKQVKNATVEMNSTVKHFMMLDNVTWVSDKIIAFINQ
mgnify:CR=1 FL=1